MTSELITIREYLTNVLKKRGDEEPFADDDSLVATGRLDSMDVMEVAFFLEENFGLDFKESGIDAIKLDSINLIKQLIQAQAQK